MLLQMARKDGIYIPTDGYFLVGNDIYYAGNLIVYFPTDIDALARFDLVAFEECSRIIGILPFAVDTLFGRFRRGGGLFLLR